METKAYTEEEILVNNEVRNDLMKGLIKECGGIRANKIWTELGTKFETVFMNYMTIKQIAALFELKLNTKGDCPSIEKHLKSTSPHKKELEEAGVKTYTKDEMENMKNSIRTDGTDCEVIENTKNSIRTDGTDCENDITNQFRIPNRGCTLFSLEAVCKLGMFMTGTEKAKEFRNLIIRELEESPVKDKVIEDSYTVMYETLLENMKTKQELNQATVIKLLKMMEITSTLSKSGLEGYRKDLENLIKEANSMKNKFLRDDPEMNDEYTFTLCFNTVSTVSLIQNKLKEVDRQLENYRDKVLQSIGTEVKTNFTDIIAKRIGEEPTKKEINEVKNKLVAAGILEIHKYDKYEFVTKENEDGTLVKERTLKRNNKNEIVQGSNYLPVKNFEWINTAKIGMFSNDKRAQIIKFSEYGCKLINYILDEIEANNDVSSLTQEKFEDYLVSIS